MLSFVQVRKAIHMTAKCGTAYLDAKEPHKETKLPKRKHFTTKLLPKLDETLDSATREFVDKGGDLHGFLVLSDGWESIQTRPIINAIAASPYGRYHMEALDTAGKTKSMQFIADFVIKHIKKLGRHRVVAVCMDGACEGAFAIIEAEFPEIVCFICPTHSIDGYIKNVVSSQDEIKVRGREETLPRGETIFADTIDDVWEVVKFITSHHFTLTLYREKADAISDEDKEHPKGLGGTEFPNSATRASHPRYS